MHRCEVLSSILTKNREYVRVVRSRTGRHQWSIVYRISRVEVFRTDSRGRTSRSFRNGECVDIEGSRRRRLCTKPAG